VRQRRREAPPERFGQVYVERANNRPLSILARLREALAALQVE
jgi:hypothetical protein